MKHIFKYQTKISGLIAISITIFSLIITSCELEIEPESLKTDGNFYDNENDLNLAMIATYASFRDVMDSEWNLTELRSDNTFLDPERSANADTDRFTLDRLNIATSNPINRDYYAAAYKTIALANKIIENLNVVADPDFKNQLQGEALFIRGLMHFNLVRLYGGIVISDKVLIGEEGFQLPRQIEDVVYDFIIQDLKNAIDLLPSAYDTDQFGRATSWAARTILGKVYLTIKDFELAIEQLEPVRDSGEFGLLPIYEDIFNPALEINNETIFAVRYEKLNGDIGSPFPSYFAPRGSLGNVTFGDGSGFNIPTESISNLYENNDVRKLASMSDSYVNDAGTEVLSKHIIKYNSPGLAILFDGDVDWQITRFADVLLMLAEAYIETDGVDTALIELNKVRVRAGLNALTNTDVSSYFEFKFALETERRLEFAFENHRFFDLLRTGRALTVINQHFLTEFTYADPDPNNELGAEQISENNLLLPIPQYEIDLNPNLAQNIGY